MHSPKMNAICTFGLQHKKEEIALKYCITHQKKTEKRKFRIGNNSVRFITKLLKQQGASYRQTLNNGK
jgi:hypothetical protein